jgi:hypothetical protein
MPGGAQPGTAVALHARASGGECSTAPVSAADPDRVSRAEAFTRAYLTSPGERSERMEVCCRSLRDACMAPWETCMALTRGQVIAIANPNGCVGQSPLAGSLLCALATRPMTRAPGRCRSAGLGGAVVRPGQPDPKVTLMSGAQPVWPSGGLPRDQQWCCPYQGEHRGSGKRR